MAANWNLKASKPTVPGSTVVAVVCPVNVSLPKSETTAVVIKLPLNGKVPLSAVASVTTSVAATTLKPTVLPAVEFWFRSKRT